MLRLRSGRVERRGGALHHARGRAPLLGPIGGGHEQGDQGGQAELQGARVEEGVGRRDRSRAADAHEGREEAMDGEAGAR